MMRTLVVGAHRRRQGIGPFIARFLAEAGADVAAVVGSTSETAREAADNLRASYQLDTRSYGDLPRALDQEQPELVAICSPYRFHREQLEQVARTSAHVLCEKPMWWEEGEGDRRRETERLVDGFLDRGRHFALVTQWPYTLEGFFELFPDLRDERVERFEMHLAPASTGTAGILDAAPHVISMLQALVGTGAVKEPPVRSEDLEGRVLHLSFEYDSPRGRTAVRCVFETREAPPRPAAYAINGRRVDREIELPEYSMSLVASSESARDGEPKTRRQKIRDPLELLIRDLLRRIREGAAVDRTALIQSVTHLETLTATTPSNPTES